MPSRQADVPLSPCVVVVKTPVAFRKRVADRLVRTGRRLAAGVEEAAREQARTLATLQAALARLGIAPQTMSVDALDSRARRALGQARFVVCIGGDGTLLAASHWVKGGLLLGVNSAPRSSVGYLTLTRRVRLARDLERITQGTLLPLPVARVEVELDGRLLSPALNDVLIAHESPAATSRYRLRLGRKATEHRSSGLWIATPTGSTAGIRSAGGQPMPLAERRLQFRARELYRAKGGASLESGFVVERQELVVESAMEAGWLFIDGARMAIPFPFGASATFRIARQPLLLFADPERWATRWEPP